MARLSDVIEALIKDMIEEQDGRVEITRGELADRVNCVPSQITYVLETRFTHDLGYLVQSRRGGGGWIRIERIVPGEDKSAYIMHTVNSLDQPLTQHMADIYLRNFVDYGILTEREANLMQAAICDQALAPLPRLPRSEVRTSILKSMLVRYLLDYGRESDVAERDAENKEKSGKQKGNGK
ncbi:MAG: CtsR family transcriptional regulator [Clostridiaceae bacterium]|nr:CtsR family transcriptional regulator [Clostridiaceae bacterium]